MDGATLQARIYAGRAKAAARIGLACTQYRPLTATAPLGNQVGTLLAAFNAGDSAYRQPNKPGDPLWYADLDGRLTQPGDYLVRQSDGNVWYIAGQQPLLPIMAIECNRSVRVTRVKTPTGVGVQGYNGVSAAAEQAVLGTPSALWPASILFGGKQDAATLTPASAKRAGWRILLPPSVPVPLAAGDFITDDLGRRFVLDGAEQTDTGWRINAQEVHA